MKLTGLANLFLNEMEGANGTWYKPTISVGKKLENGEYDNTSLDAYLDNESKEALLENYGANTCIKIDIKEAYLSFRRFERDNGTNGISYNVVIVSFAEVNEEDTAPKKASARPLAKKTSAKAPAKKTYKK